MQKFANGGGVGERPINRFWRKAAISSDRFWP